MENEFPPNSHANREAAPARTTEKASEKKAVAQITKGKVVLRKKPLHRKFIEAFKTDSDKGFAEYVLIDVLVPGIKDSLADSAMALIDTALGVGGGGSRASRSRGTRGGSYTSYSGMGGSARPRGRDRDDDRRPSRREPRSSAELGEVILDTRVEADEVVEGLFELISKYEVATKRDFLSMVGEPHSFTDEDWGWTDLRGARVHRVRGGYLIDLPRLVSLD